MGMLLKEINIQIKTYEFIFLVGVLTQGKDFCSCTLTEIAVTKSNWHSHE